MDRHNLIERVEMIETKQQEQWKAIALLAAKLECVTNCCAVVSETKEEIIANIKGEKA